MIRISGKIPINIHPAFWVVALLIGYINSSWMPFSMMLIATLLWVGVILVSILFHEFGHALTAMFFGQRARIDLVGFGGLTQRLGKKIKLWQDFIIVLNGPLAGFSLGLIAYIIQQRFFATVQGSSWIAFTLQVAIWVNIFWTIINLLPVLPLDGGRLMSIIFEGIFGFKGVKIAYFVSIILATLLAVFFFAIQQLLVGGLFLLMGYESYRSWRASMGLTEQDQDATIRTNLRRAEELIQNGNKTEAITELERLREKAKVGVIFNTATQFLADLYFEQGNYQKAFDLLYPIKSEIDPAALRMLHQSAYRIGNLKESIELGDKSYHTYPSYDTALINAFCYAMQGLERPAIGWLQCSIREGLPNVNEVLQKRDFDKIRSLPMFQQLVNSTRA